MSGSRQIRRTPVKLTAEQETFLAVRSLATNYASGYRIEPHQHPWHQFLYAISGAMTVATKNSSWMIPTGRAVFIPAGCAGCGGGIGQSSQRPSKSAR
jgi:quercetin dioxygenase-like cupin family protein